MDFINLAKKRYSVRDYCQTPVEQEKLDTILQAGQVAPTAANRQPNHFLVLNTSESLAKLSKGANLHGAPLAIVICGDKNSVWIRPFDNHNMLDIDATIATDHLMLCAEDLGLSSCWITYFDPQIVRTEMNLPSNLVPINILVIGYSADKMPQSENRHTQTRKPLSSMITYGSF